MELKLARDVKGNKKGFYKQVTEGRLEKMWACYSMRWGT